MHKKIYLFLISLVLVVPFGYANSEEGAELFENATVLTSTAKKYTEHDLYQNKVVWVDDSYDFKTGRNIYLYDSEKKRGEFVLSGRRPSIYGNKIVYIDADTENNTRELYNSWYVFLYNIDTNKIQKIAHCTDDTWPSIYGDWIAWGDSFGETGAVYLYKISTGVETKLHDRRVKWHESGSPVVSNRWVVWSDGSDVYGYDMEEGVKKKLNIPAHEDHTKFDIYGDKIVWLNEGIVYVFDLTRPLSARTLFLENKEFISRPFIYKHYVSVVAYKDTAPGQREQRVFFNNLKTNKTFNMATASRIAGQLDLVDPKIDGNNMLIADTYGNLTLLPFGLLLISESNIDMNLSKKLAGKILLDVDNGGAIWYVDQIKYQRHGVTWDNALTLFQGFSLGITNKDLLKIPANLESIKEDQDDDGDGYADKLELSGEYNPYNSRVGAKFKLDRILVDKLKGKFLLQVEGGGAIWYVSDDGYRYNVRWDNLMDIFRKLSLGISFADLDSIEVYW